MHRDPDFERAIIELLNSYFPKGFVFFFGGVMDCQCGKPDCTGITISPIASLSEGTIDAKDRINSMTSAYAGAGQAMAYNLLQYAQKKGVPVERLRNTIDRKIAAAMQEDAEKVRAGQRPFDAYDVEGPL